MNEFDTGTSKELTKKESTISDMVVSRQAQEVQAAMIIAKRFPRDEAVAFDKIIRSCQRKGLAEQAEYTYPRGGIKVNGPSIRLAESVAQNWGNIDYGIIELEQRQGISEMMAYAWDLETNTRVTKIFSVKHIRDTKEKSYALTSGRDIYEETANFGARRVRSCILGIIPGDITEAARKECRKTLKGSYTEPLADRFRKIVTVFEKEFLVSKKQVETYLGYNIENTNENDYIKMQGVYRSLRDGMSEVNNFFKTETTATNPFDDKEEGTYLTDKQAKVQGASEICDLKKIAKELKLSKAIVESIEIGNWHKLDETTCDRLIKKANEAMDGNA